LELLFLVYFKTKSIENPAELQNNHSKTNITKRKVVNFPDIHYFATTGDNAILKKRLFYIFIVSVCLFSGCSPISVKNKSRQSVSLKEQLDSLLATPNLANAIVGLSVHSMKSGEILYEKNENTSLVPASNLKLFTTATALHVLGADYRIKSMVFLRGEMQDSTFTGDVILKSLGDPTLRWENHLSTVPQFKACAQQLKATGIHEIRGRLIGDDDYLDEQKYGVGWSWENEPFRFQPQISALSVSDNCIEFKICGGDSVGAPVQIFYTPPFSNIIILNRAITVDAADSASVAVSRNPGSNEFTISGAITPQAVQKILRTIDNPTLCTMSLLAHVFQQNGVRFTGAILDIDDIENYSCPADSTLFFQFDSPPLADIVKKINKESRNLDAELLLKIIGRETKGQGSSAAGAQVVQDYWQSLGVNIEQMNIVDGSGLSRKNLLTPASLVLLLTKMRSDSVFYDSLPISALETTMDKSFGSNYNNIRAKTGTLDFVKALSGYIKTVSGDELVFSLIINHYLVETEKILYIQNMFYHLLSQL
jgi:D-alanyl-D-alanine carboxypeptidase/D-alanyl-D-alanine-endopeptidase (penicillin-binding protein 4)